MSVPRRPLGSIHPQAPPITTANVQPNYLVEETVVPVPLAVISEPRHDYLFLWFLFILVVVGLILYYTNWSIVQYRNADGTPTGQASWVKALFGGVLIAALVSLGIWFFRG